MKSSTVPSDVPFAAELRRYAASVGLEISVSQYHDVPQVILSWKGPLSLNEIAILALKPGELDMNANQYAKSLVTYILRRFGALGRPAVGLTLILRRTIGRLWKAR